MREIRAWQGIRKALNPQAMRPLHTLAAVAAIILSACTHLATPSGQPEVNIPKSQKAAFTSALTNELLNERWSIAEQGENFMVFELVGLEGVQMFFNGYSQRPRVRLNFVEIGGNVRVVASLTILARGAFGRQSEEPVLPTRYVQTWQNRLLKAAGQQAPVTALTPPKPE